MVACVSIWLERVDFDHLTGLDGQKRLRALWHQWQEILHAIGLGAQDYDGNAAASHVLLILDVAIAGEKYVPAAMVKSSPFFLEPKPA